MLNGKFQLRKEILLSEKAIICYFIIIRLIIFLYPHHYGIFRDEFLYISMSKHLGLGYLEVPPLAPLILAGVRFLLGISYLSMHLVPVLLSSGVIIVSALIVKKMGGSIYAMILCLICVTLAPSLVALDTIYDYNSFDALFWTISIYMILLLLVSEDKKYWLYFGLFAGLGLISKITMLYLGFTLFISFLALKDRKYLFDKRFLIGGLIAAFIFLPYLLWQAYYHFPIIEYFKGYAGKLSHYSPLQYVFNQIDSMNRPAFPVWILGLIYFLFHKEGKKYRVFGLAYIFLCILFISQNAKSYLIRPYYTVLFAGGAVFIMRLIENIKITWLKTATVTVVAVYALLITVYGVLSIPYVRPVLTPEAFIKYSGRGKFSGDEKFDSGLLPQFFADCFGWEELSENVSDVYQKLSDPDKKKVCILTGNYGEAGALQFYGPKYGLPDPVCSQNIWYFWGPGRNTGSVMIIVGFPGDFYNTLTNNFDNVEIERKTVTKYAMPYENENPIFLCRGLHMPLTYYWKKIKHFE
jgi:hypothetical protein